MESSERDQEVRVAVMELKQLMGGLDWEETIVVKHRDACYHVRARFKGGDEQTVVMEWDEGAGMVRAVRPGDEAWEESDAACRA